MTARTGRNHHVTTPATCDHTGITRAWCQCADCTTYQPTTADLEAIRASLSQQQAANPPIRYGLTTVDLDQPNQAFTPTARRLDRINTNATIMCAACGNYPHTQDRNLCAWCAEQWEIDLLNVGPLAEDLNLAETRRTRMGATAGKASDTSMPYDPRAAKALEALRATIATLCDALNLHTQPWQLDTAARAIHARHRDISHRADAPQLAGGLRDTVRRGFTVIDRPRPTTYLGACPKCALAMHAREGAATHQCACGTIVLVDQLLTERQAAIADMLVTWPELLGSKVAPRSTLYRWRQERRLIPVTEWNGHPMYRYGDAQQLRDA